MFIFFWLGCIHFWFFLPPFWGLRVPPGSSAKCIRGEAMLGEKVPTRPYEFTSRPQAPTLGPEMSSVSPRLGLTKRKGETHTPYPPPPPPPQTTAFLEAFPESGVFQRRLFFAQRFFSGEAWRRSRMRCSTASSCRSSGIPSPSSWKTASGLPSGSEVWVRKGGRPFQPRIRSRVLVLVFFCFLLFGGPHDFFPPPSRQDIEFLFAGVRILAKISAGSGSERVGLLHVHVAILV